MSKVLSMPLKAIEASLQKLSLANILGEDLQKAAQNGAEIIAAVRGRFSLADASETAESALEAIWKKDEDPQCTYTVMVVENNIPKNVEIVHCPDEARERFLALIRLYKPEEPLHSDQADIYLGEGHASLGDTTISYYRVDQGSIG